MIRVTWKDEDHNGVEAIGPVTVVDTDEYEAWKRREGIADDALGIPYGSKPDGVTERGWLPLSEAKAIAAEHNVELEVS